MTITGVFCAAATPFDETLSPDGAKLARHCSTLIEEGCHGVALLGSTGEANSLTIAERRDLLETVLGAGLEPGQLLPGTGLASYLDTIELTRHALDVGVTTVVMLPPFYYKEPGDEGLVESYARIFDAIADPRLRVILYHIPQFSQAPITPGVIAQLRDRYPETVIGMKDSAGDRERMVAICEQFKDFSVLPGADPLMLELLKKGGAGCITATSNLVASDLRLIFDGWQNEAQSETINAAQERVIAARNKTNSYAQIPTVKALIGHKYDDPGWRRMRPPFLPLTEAQYSALG